MTWYKSAKKNIFVERFGQNTIVDVAHSKQCTRKECTLWATHYFVFYLSLMSKEDDVHQGRCVSTLVVCEAHADQKVAAQILHENKSFQANITAALKMNGYQEPLWIESYAQWEHLPLQGESLGKCFILWERELR